MQGYVDTMAADGGGDGPEAVADGLHDILNLTWRPNSTKVCVLIADAPPHGLGEDGDGFPNGCPHGHDPLKICRQLETLGVVVYAVGVEPLLSTSYKYARDFMMSVASITNGKYLPLGKAELLSKVIVGGSIEGLVMDHLWEEVEKELLEAKSNGTGLSDAAVAEKVQHHLKGKVTSYQVKTECPYGDDYDDFNVNCMLQSECLQDMKAQLNPTKNSSAAAKVSDFRWDQQDCRADYDEVSTEQVQRMAYKKGFFKK
jgi:hypothetical protein